MTSPSSAGKLAFTSTYPCTPTGDSATRACMRIVTLSNANPAIEPTRLGDTLLGSNGFDVSFGGIAWSGSGVLDAVYTRSSSTSDASSFAQYNLPTDTPISWSSPQLLTAGAAQYTGTRWGDYTILASDPRIRLRSGAASNTLRPMAPGRRRSTSSSSAAVARATSRSPRSGSSIRAHPLAARSAFPG